MVPNPRSHFPHQNDAQPKPLFRLDTFQNTYNNQGLMLVKRTVGLEVFLRSSPSPSPSPSPHPPTTLPLQIPPTTHYTYVIITGRRIYLDYLCGIIFAYMGNPHQFFDSYQVFSTLASQSTPESRLWGAFLVLILRDIVPVYVTIPREPGRTDKRTPRFVESLTSTYIFELACEAVGFSPDYLRRRFLEISQMDPTPSQILLHNRKYPDGVGRSSLYPLTLGSVYE